jgi:O-antigen/teichoic acid export membrane protein
MNKTLKNILYVFTAISISKFVGAFTSFLIPKILDPANYGIWVTLLLIVSYAPIIAFGTVEALMRQYPYFIGKGELTKAKEIESSVFSSIILSALLLILAGFSFLYFLKIESIEKFLPQIRMMILASAMGLFSAFFSHRFAAHQSFKAFGIIDSTRAVLTLLIVVSCSWFWGLKGTVYGFAITEFIMCFLTAILSFRICGGVGVNFNRDLIWNAIRIGLPISLVWWVITLESSVDRAVSSWLLGKNSTGYYGLGLSIVTIIILIPRAINRVFFPKINEGIGKNLDFKALSSLVIQPGRIFSIFLPIIVSTLILIVPLIYQFIFPKYLKGLVSAEILIAGSFFLCLVGNGVNYLIAKNRQNILLIYAFICLAINFCTAIIMAKLGFGIAGIAASTSISSMILATLIWNLVFSDLGYCFRERLREIISLYSPLLLSMILILLLKYTIFMVPVTIIPTGIVYTLSVIIFLTLYSIIVLSISPYSVWTREMYNFIRISVNSKNKASLS